MKLGQAICAMLCVLLACQGASAISQANFYHSAAKNGYKQLLEVQAGNSQELDTSLDYHFIELELNSEAEFKDWVAQEAKTMRVIFDSLKAKHLKHDLYTQAQVTLQDNRRVRAELERSRTNFRQQSLKLEQLASSLKTLIETSSPKTVIIVTKKFRSSGLSVSAAEAQVGESEVSRTQTYAYEEAKEHLEHAEFRRVMQGNSTKAGNSTTPAKVYVKPDAVFGIGLSIFIFFITYVAVMCLYDVKTPKNFAQKQLKFGKEM